MRRSGRSSVESPARTRRGERLALALALAYIAGGTIMNILRHELPDTDRSGDVVAFATAATVYGALLLSLSPGG